MPGNENNNLSGVVTGVAVLVTGVAVVVTGIVAVTAAAGTGLFGFLNNRNNQHKNRSSRHGEASPSSQVDRANDSSVSSLDTATTMPSAQERENIKKCEVCSTEIKENFFGLDCEHEFHKQCLLARYCLSEEPAAFKCPAMDCNEKVMEGKISSLTS